MKEIIGPYHKRQREAHCADALGGACRAANRR
jgi:hypothetical protein